MYRDMTRGSITQGLLLFALPMAAGDPCGAGLCAGGAGGRQRHLGRYPYRLGSGGRRGIRLLLPPAQSAAPWGERRLIRGIKQSDASPMNCTPFVGQYGILSNKWGHFMHSRLLISTFFFLPPSVHADTAAPTRRKTVHSGIP